ncbi:MAG: hypothetical protein M3Q48_06660 [Actinomycetota bacterium]|nr:hypothetical protein [Actinomycetota bacterium]
MTPRADDGPAAPLVLRPEDLLDAGWRELCDADRPGEPGDEAGLGVLLASRFPEQHVRAVADSPAFVRPPALLAYSTAVVLADEAAARRAFAVVASAEFASSFAHAVGTGVMVGQGEATFLGSTATPLALEAGPGEGAAHRISFGGATADALVPAYVDLVALAARDRVMLLWLASAPAPFPAAERDRVVARTRGRLAAA